MTRVKANEAQTKKFSRHFVEQAYSEHWSRPASPSDARTGDGREERSQIDSRFLDADLPRADRRAQACVLAQPGPIRPARREGGAGRARLPRRLRRCAAQPAGFGPLAGRAEPSADGARDREPLLAAGLRHRPRQDGRGFRHPGRAAPHPELLDWLAVEFREDGWDVKRFMKRLVMSATYRQSRGSTPRKPRPRTRTTAAGRGPRFRLDAEMIRDQALAASGCWSTGRRPERQAAQPAGLWEAVGYTTATPRTSRPTRAPRSSSPQPLHLSGSGPRRRRR